MKQFFKSHQMNIYKRLKSNIHYEEIVSSISTTLDHNHININLKGRSLKIAAHILYLIKRGVAENPYWYKEGYTHISYDIFSNISNHTLYSKLLMELKKAGYINFEKVSSENSKHNYNIFSVNETAYSIPETKILDYKLLKAVVESEIINNYDSDVRLQMAMDLMDVTIDPVTEEEYWKRVDTPKCFKKFKLKNHKSIKNLSDDEQYGEFIIKNVANYTKMVNWNSKTPYLKLISPTIKDSFGWRYHSILSSIPSWMRNRVKLNGEDLSYCLDLKQSQPTLLGHILKCKKGDNVFTDKINKQVRIYGEWLDDNGEEDKGYVFQLLYGKMYGILAKKLEYKYDHKFKSFMYDIKKVKDDPIKKIDINDISIPVDVNGKYVLPQIMQRYESLMFQDVWVYLKITGIRFLSLHDGLYFIDNVSEDTINDIKNIISKYIDVFFSFHYDKVENK